MTSPQEDVVLSTKSLARAVLLPLLGVALAAAAGLACSRKSPADKIAEVRNQYTVQDARPQKQNPIGDASAMDVALSEGEEAREAGTAAPAQAARPTSILFDVVLSFRGSQSLPGITLDITHTDAQGRTKEVRRQYVETPKMTNSGVLQQGFVLDNLQYEEGDGFQVDVRSFIPVEERGEYREFAAGQ